MLRVGGFFAFYYTRYNLIRPCSPVRTFDISVQGKALLRGEIMKITLLLCVILAACTFGFAKEKADVRDITGCLSKGDSANEFLLTRNDGGTWEVRSSKVALAEHVGHMVTATGVVSHAAMHNMKEDAKEA